MWIGDGLNYACMFLIDTLGNWSVVALYAALQPLLIVLVQQTLLCLYL